MVCGGGVGRVVVEGDRRWLRCGGVQKGKRGSGREARVWRWFRRGGGRWRERERRGVCEIWFGGGRGKILERLVWERKKRKGVRVGG